MLLVAVPGIQKPVDDATDDDASKPFRSLLRGLGKPCHLEGTLS